MSDVYKKIIELRESAVNAALCTVVRTKGSTPLKAGAKMIVCADGKTYGTVGGGSLEKQTIEDAHRVIRTNKEQIKEYNLNSDDGNSCGGISEIFIEPLLKKFRLYVFGAGHVGRALFNICSGLDFDIVIIDDRDKIFDEWPDEGYTQVVSSHVDYLGKIELDDRSFVAIMTYDHEIDWEILSFCAAKPWYYLGMMGSRKKVKGMSKLLLDMGISQDKIDRIDMPIGLGIGAESASEIAVSIAAGLIKAKSELAEKLKSEK